MLSLICGVLFDLLVAPVARVFVTSSLMTDLIKTLLVCLSPSLLFFSYHYYEEYVAHKMVQDSNCIFIRYNFSGKNHTTDISVSPADHKRNCDH